VDGKRSFTEVLIAWRGFVYRFTIVAALGAVVVSLLLPQWYTASAVITPPSETDGGTGLMALMDQVRGGGAVSRARSLLKRTPEIDLMIGVLKSRRVQGEVVDRFDLVSHYHVKSREKAIKRLGDQVGVTTTPEGFIAVHVSARDKQLAADMANAFVESLDGYNQETSVETARSTREFVGQRLDEVRARLDEASNNLRRFQEEHGAIHISEQTRVTVEALASLEGERMQLEIERGVLKNYSRGEVPRIREIDAHIEEIEKRIVTLRGRTPAGSTMVAMPGDDGTEVAAPDGDGSANDDVIIPLGEFPRLGLEFADLKREVLAQEKVLEFLMAQFEEARIREARDLETVNVLDPAVPPLRKSKPRRSVIVLLTTGLGLVFSIGLAFAISSLEEVTASHPQWSQIREVRWLLRVAGWIRGWGGPAVT
jgi:uncharacterized protein involved in exopolysaccharide biosynthesis